MPRPKTATIVLKLRVREPLRKSVELAAKDRGVSMNAEMVHRLEGTFQQEDARDHERASIIEVVHDALGGEILYRFFRIISAAAAEIERVKGKPVDQDRRAWAAFKEATISLFDQFAPKRGARSPSLLLQTAEGLDDTKLGQEAADLMMMKARILMLEQELKNQGVNPNNVVYKTG